MFVKLEESHFELCGLCIFVLVPFSQGKKIEATPLSMYNFFIDKVRANLHVVLAMSPIGDAFRNRLRMFPSLINCCTIDWFQVRPLTRLSDSVIAGPAPFISCPPPPTRSLTALAPGCAGDGCQQVLGGG